jgi:hypothetical protein
MAEVKYIGLAAMRARALAAIEEAVNQSAEDLVGRAMEATPVETGTLRASIHTDGAEVAGDEVKAIVATGGESSAYAIYIHEGHRADGSHVIRAYPGGAKYLERPLIEGAAAYAEAMRAAAEAAF